MFQAGTDTSFIVLEYAMIKLMQNPNLMTKLQDELRMTIPKGKDIVTEDELNGMSYLKAVIKETLRLHGPAPLLVPHLSMAECDIEGYTIPSGTRVIVNAWALARDPTYWESAERFMPERFLEGGSAMTMDFRGTRFPLLAIWGWAKDLPRNKLCHFCYRDHASKPCVPLQLGATTRIEEKWH